MLLPVPPIRAVQASHAGKEALALDVNPIARDHLERAARLDLGGDVDESPLRAFLQPLVEERRQRFLAGRKHKHGSVRGFPQTASGGRARASTATRELVDDLLRRTTIGERDFVE